MADYIIMPMELKKHLGLSVWHFNDTFPVVYSVGWPQIPGLLRSHMYVCTAIHQLLTYKTTHMAGACINYLRVENGE